MTKGEVVKDDKGKVVVKDDKGKVVVKDDGCRVPKEKAYLSG